MKTSEVARRLNISPASVRQWTQENGPYADFMSDSATGGKRREFTDKDARILARVAELSASRLTQAEIAAELEAMRAAGWPDLPPLPPLPGHDNDVPMVTADKAQSAIEKAHAVTDARVNGLIAQIDQLEKQVTKLEAQLDQARQEHKQEAHALQDQLNELLDQRGQLAGQLQAVEAGGQRERTLYRAVLIAAAVLAVVLLAVVLIMATGG